MQLNETHTPKRRLSSNNDGCNQPHAQNRFRVSIPSTRATSRAVDNPLTTDSLKLYADQFQCYFPEFSNDYKQIIGGFDSSISCSDEGHETPYSNQGTLSSSTYSSFENSTSNSEISFQSCRSGSSRNSMKYQVDNLFGGLPETSDQFPPAALESNHDDIKHIPRTCSSLSAASPGSAIDKLSGPEISRRSSSDGHLSSAHNIPTESSIKVESSADVEEIHSSYKSSSYHSSHVSLIVPFSIVAPCECLRTAVTHVDSTSSSLMSVNGLSSFESPYEVTTLDEDQLQWMHIQVKHINRLNNPLNTSYSIQPTPTSSSSQLMNDIGTESRWHLALQSFHQHVPLFPIGWNEMQSTFWVNVRIFVNLIKPVKISLRRMTSSLNSQFEDVCLSPNGMRDQLKNLSMFLPRGTCKQVHLHIDTTAGETVRALLDNLFIADPPHKFAIYEHYIRGGKQILVTKLPNHCSVLQRIFEWATNDSEDFCEKVKNCHFVLQEDEPTSIEWSNFSLPELYNFLRILDLEEDQYRRTLRQQFEFYQCCIIEAMTRLKLKSTSGDQHCCL